MIETQDILFSIIMPAYNAEKYIGAAIESVLRQTYTNWQLVIVDDGSKDHTLEIATKYAKEDEENGGRIEVIYQENSGTAAAARNTALKYIRGEYVQLLDSDDYLSDDCLEKYYPLVKEDKEIDVIDPLCYSVTDDGEIQFEIAKVSTLLKERISGEKAFDLSLDWTVHGVFLVKTELIQRIQYDEELVNGDEFTTRKVFYNAKVVIFCDAVYYYRDNLESTTKCKQNVARMYESLITDGNIYRYSVEQDMPDWLQEKCAKKWIRSLVAHQAQMNREYNGYSDEDITKIRDIIMRNYEEISQTKLENMHSVFAVLYRLSGKKYQLFCRLTGFYNFIWRIVKRRMR